MPRLRLLALLIACFALAVVAEDKPKPEAYSGVIVGTGGSVGAKSMQFDFHITSYTTDQEVQQLAHLLKEKGQEALQDKLFDEDRGRIRPVTSTGNAIAIARKRKDGPDTIITIVTARNMPFLDLYGGRIQDYPFGILQVKLNEKGEGVGQIMAAAKLKFNKKKGHYELESYGNQYLKAVNIRPE